MMHGSRSERKYNNERTKNNKQAKQKQLNYTCTGNSINFLSKKILHAIFQLFSGNLLSSLAIIAFFV